MIFGPVPLVRAEGLILGHNVSDSEGRRVLRKGVLLDESHLATLRELGLESVYAAELEPRDVPEDEAADRAARWIRGDGISASRSHTGRVNLTSDTLGVLHVEVDTLLDANRIDGLTVATLPSYSTVRAGQRVATVKVIPFALPEEALAPLDDLRAPVAHVRPIPSVGVSVVLTGSLGSRDRVSEGLGTAIRTRMEGYSATIDDETFVMAEHNRVAQALESAAKRSDLVIVGGETAIMDMEDVIPRGLRAAGGTVEHLGLPMDPGHLLLLGYLDGTPVVGAPGCVRGRNPDGFDAVVPRLLSGERLSADDLLRMGHGGLLSNPRSSA